MPFLVDTDIALRLFNTTDFEHPLVANAIRKLSQSGETLYYTQQSRREFWNVCTRPGNANGWELNTTATVDAINGIELFLTYLPDTPAAGPEWDRLVRQYDVKGRAVHDAQLVASMLVNGITHLLTLNGADFQRYRGEVTVVHPRDV